MLRYYLDSNIFRKLKPTHGTYSESLYNYVQSIKELVLFNFSDAHLDDLKASNQSFRDEDLRQMEEYVQDNYYSRDAIQNRDEILLATPLEAFYSKDYALAENFIKDFNIDVLLEDLPDDPLSNALRNYLETLFNLPIGLFGETIPMDTLTSENKAYMDKLLPDYSPDMSLKNFIASLNPYGSAFLTDPKEFQGLRDMIATYMNHDDYSYEKWGMEFNERFREKLSGMSFMDNIDNMLLEKQKNDLYLKFQYAYGLLEMYNITQEKVGGKRKKLNYQSLQNDSNHAYFAAYSDYLVTDDKGLQVKATILYTLLNIPTIVLSSQEFQERRIIITGNEETWESFTQSLVHDLKHAMLLFSTTYIGEGIRADTYKLSHDYFNYFNRLKIEQWDLPRCVLYCERKTTANSFMYREIELLVRKLVKVFGMDDDNKGEYLMNEKDESHDYIRKWSLKEVTYWLLTQGGFLCLTFIVQSSEVPKLKSND
ncbi:MAG: hypothetical protein K0S09_1468 [Sphingobacteriaceae bacterium]|nr:hypothetical protein [Sphingobacteriaceae bacterium]